MGFAGLYNRLSPGLRWIARRYNNGSILTKEDELYQEMCIYLWEHYGRGVPDGINDSYIVKGCEFHIRNYIRTHKEKAELCSLDSPINYNGNTIEDILADHCEEVERSVERNIIFDGIMNNGFTRREKDVLSLLLKGYTVRETGHRLGISHVMVVKLKKNIIRKWQRKACPVPNSNR